MTADPHDHRHNHPSKESDRMDTMRPKPPSPIAGHPGANPAYEAWTRRHRLTRAAVYRARTRGGGRGRGWTARVYVGPRRTISCGFPTREAALAWANARVHYERARYTRWTAVAGSLNGGTHA